jgi:hypothetical protein
MEPDEATLTDEEIETRPMEFASHPVAETPGDSDTTDATDDTGDDSGDTSDTTDTGDDSGDDE